MRFLRKKNGVTGAPYTTTTVVVFNAHPVKHYKTTITRTLISKRRYYNSLKKL